MLCLLLLATHSFASLLSLIASVDSLSTLNFHINASTTLTNLLSTGNNFTFVAPSNQAFDAFFAEQSPTTPSEADVEALLTYHILVGGWPSAMFLKDFPRFVPTQLNDPSLANVTGGQVVGLFQDASGKPMFISGNKTSTVIAQQVRQ